MALNQADTWKHLFSIISSGKCHFLKTVALELQSIAGKAEALDWGAFRTGNVTISGSDYEPPWRAKLLDEEWLKIETEISAIGDVYDRALAAFLKMARSQLFWDVNKRMVLIHDEWNTSFTRFPHH